LWEVLRIYRANEDENGRRSGEVILALFIDGKMVATKANLNSEQYSVNYKMHGKGGGIINIRARLVP